MVLQRNSRLNPLKEKDMRSRQRKATESDEKDEH